MSIKDSLKLNSGWGWGIFGFILSTLISWMAPFGRLPRQFFENTYQHFEVYLVEKQYLDGLKIRRFDPEVLLDYPGNEVDYTGILALENTLSSDLKVNHISLFIDEQPVGIRLWQPAPDHLDPHTKQEFKFYTRSVPKKLGHATTFKIEVLDSLGRNSTSKTSL